MIRLIVTSLLLMTSSISLAHGPEPHRGSTPAAMAHWQPSANAVSSGRRDTLPPQSAAQDDVANAEHAPARFCMKNRNGKMHCVPFGPAH